MLEKPIPQLDKIKTRISNAAHQAGRDAKSIVLVGASKQQSVQRLTQLADAGLRDMGENYLQEALAKQTQLSNYKLNWHFIGQIQSNKTKLIAQHFDWVHGVDRIKIAQRLAQYANKKLNLLVQVNIDQQHSKAGVCWQNTPALCAQISQLDGILLRGLMLLPAPRQDPAQQRKVFAQARELLSLTNQRYELNLDTLSMGMSNDFEAAILEGSTMVRVGTDLFGSRS